MCLSANYGTGENLANEILDVDIDKVYWSFSHEVLYVK